MNLDFIPGLLADTDFKIVDYASQMDFVGNSQESRELPAVFFHLFKRQAQPVETNFSTRQIMDVMVAFKVVAKNKDLDTYLDQLASKMKGHAPSNLEVIRPFEYVGGEVVDVDKSTIWWREVYRIQILKT